MADATGQQPVEHAAEQSTEQSAQQPVEVDEVGVINLPNGPYMGHR